MIKRKFIFSVMMALAFLLSVSGDTFAQDPARLSALNISLWPEFDRPSVLVIVHGILAGKGNLPREVSVLVPAKAEVIVTTYVNPDGRQAPEQVFRTTEDSAGYKRITFTIATAEYWLEYYDDLLKGTPDKTLDFALKLSAPADKVAVEIQQPARATNFSTTPPTQPSRIDPSDGLTYYTLQFANIGAGQSVSAQIKYTRAETRLTKDLLASAAPSASNPLAAVPQEPSAWQNAFFIAAAVILGLVAVFGIFILRRQPTASATARQPARNAPKKARRAPTSNGAPATAFCTQCGRALRAEDNFCPRCGTQRRNV